MNQINERLPLSSKKPYEKPCLRVYGDIGTLTQAIGMTVGQTDNNPSGNQKTF